MQKSPARVEGGNRRATWPSWFMAQVLRTVSAVMTLWGNTPGWKREREEGGGRSMGRKRKDGDPGDNAVKTMMRNLANEQDVS